jgi:hypothetical protein
MPATATLIKFPNASFQSSVTRDGLELVCSLQAQLQARLQERQEELDPEDRKLIMTVGTLFREQLDAAKREGLEQGIEQGIERGRLEGRLEGVEEGVEQGIHRGQRLILENLLRVRFGELDPIMPVLMESIAALPPEQFTLFLLKLSQVENDEAGGQVLPRLFVEELLKFCWGEAEEGEDRESPIQAIVAWPVEALTEILLLVKSGSKDEVLSAIADR